MRRFPREDGWTDQYSRPAISGGGDRRPPSACGQSVRVYACVVVCVWKKVRGSLGRLESVTVS